MVCIRFQGIVIVLPIDKNKSKVFGKREGFFVLIKRTACEGKYVYVLLYCRKSYIEPYIIYGPHNVCCACIVVRVLRHFSGKKSNGMYQLQTFTFYGYHYDMYVVPKLKKFSSLVRHTIDKSHISSHHHQTKVS